MQNWNCTSHFKSHLLLIWNFPDETWNEMCYLKLLKLFETFQTFQTFQTYHGGLLIWNFQMRLEIRCAIWNFWNFWNFSTHHMSCLFETFRWDLKWDMLFETFETFWNFSNFSTHHMSCLFETFKWDLKWDVLFETFQTFQPITGAAYRKLSDKTWNEICYLKHLKCLKLEIV